MSLVLSEIIDVSLLFVTLRVASPIMLAAIGGMYSDLAGAVNIGLEGLMLISAFFAVVVSALSGSAWLGLLAGVTASLLLALLLAFFSLNLKSDIIIAGFALTILAQGLSIFLLSNWFGDKGTFFSPDIKPLPELFIPFLGKIPVVGAILDGQNILVYAGLVFVILSHYVIYKTPFGLHLRSVGENPEAAASVGINVRRVQYIALLISGLFAGLAGANLSLGYLTIFVRNMTAGRGFIALAAVLFGGRKPFGVMLAALLFGFADSLGNRLQSLNMPSQLVLMLPYAFTIVAMVILAVRKQKKKLRVYEEHS